MKVSDYEIFQFANNKYTPRGEYLLREKTYLDIVLTDHCNSNCNFCIADLIHKKLTCDFTKFQEKIIFAIENLNVKEVLLLGGEPTCYKQLPEMIAWLSTLGLDKIVMTSNGFLLKKGLIEDIFSSGLTHLNLSLMSFDTERQKQISNSKYFLAESDIENIADKTFSYDVKFRINNNIFNDNNDMLYKMINFYERAKLYADSVKFSPLLRVDDFSVINYKTEWAINNILEPDVYEELFDAFTDYFSTEFDVGIIENDLQFGFVKNTMIPLTVPIILNWNFGTYSGMMDKVVKEKKINNIKLLPNNELSLSWNRELSEYFITT